MITALFVVLGLLCLASVVLLVCIGNTDAIPPAGKAAWGLQVICVAVCAVLVALILNAPRETPGYAFRGFVPVESTVRDVDTAPAAVAYAEPAPTEHAAPVAQSAPAVPAQAAAPASDSTKDMLLGGMLGYVLGSAGRNSAPAVTHVVSHTTYTPPPSPPPAFTRSPPARAAPAPSSWKSTFSMSRSRR